MAKPTEPDIATRTAPTIVQIKLQNGYFNAPPFPSINAPARSRANLFNQWETAILSQMNMGILVQELMAQLDQHLPIENASAQMKADAIGDSIYASFFKTSSTRGLCFVDQDHEEMVFENSWMRDRPAGIEILDSGALWIREQSTPTSRNRGSPQSSIWRSPRHTWSHHSRPR
jgi:hypothetical protein